MDLLSLLYLKSFPVTKIKIRSKWRPETLIVTYAFIMYILFFIVILLSLIVTKNKIRAKGRPGTLIVTYSFIIYILFL